ncbi:MAG: hypothetical protein WBV31_21285 [Terriglobales bacterium]
MNNCWRKPTTCCSMAAGVFAGRVMGSARNFDEAVLLIAAQPQGGNGRLKQTGGGLDAAKPSRLH